MARLWAWGLFLVFVQVWAGAGEGAPFRGGAEVEMVTGPDGYRETFVRVDLDPSEYLGLSGEVSRFEADDAEAGSTYRGSVVGRLPGRASLEAGAGLSPEADGVERRVVWGEAWVVVWPLEGDSPVRTEVTLTYEQVVHRFTLADRHPELVQTALGGEVRQGIVEQAEVYASYWDYRYDQDLEEAVAALLRFTRLRPGLSFLRTAVYLGGLPDRVYGGGLDLFPRPDVRVGLSLSWVEAVVGLPEGDARVYGIDGDFLVNEWVNVGAGMELYETDGGTDSFVSVRLGVYF